MNETLEGDPGKRPWRVTLMDITLEVTMKGSHEG